MINMIATAMMLGGGIVLGIQAYTLFRKQQQKLTLCHRTWAEVIDIKIHGGGEEFGPTPHPVIRYRAMNGEHVTFLGKFGNSNWRVKKGHRLEILVSPGKPTDAEVVSFITQWGLPLLLAIISGGSIISAAAVYLLI